MPTIEMPYDGTVGLFDMALAIEAVSDVTVMSASVEGGVATFYVVTKGPDTVICDYCGWDFLTTEVEPGNVCPWCGSGGLG